MLGAWTPLDMGTHCLLRRYAVACRGSYRRDMDRDRDRDRDRDVDRDSRVLMPTTAVRRKGAAQREAEVLTTRRRVLQAGSVLPLDPEPDMRPVLGRSPDRPPALAPRERDRDGQARSNVSQGGCRAAHRRRTQRNRRNLLVRSCSFEPERRLRGWPLHQRQATSLFVACCLPRMGVRVVRSTGGVIRTRHGRRSQGLPP